VRDVEALLLDPLILGAFRGGQQRDAAAGDAVLAGALRLLAAELLEVAGEQPDVAGVVLALIAALRRDVREPAVMAAIEVERPASAGS
jgi:hypothetical protein